MNTHEISLVNIRTAERKVIGYEHDAFATARMIDAVRVALQAVGVNRRSDEWLIDSNLVASVIA